MKVDAHVIAQNTPAEFVLQLDVGTCMEAGVGPVAWIEANPGRIKSVRLKDWSPGAKADEKAYRVLFGEGVSPWKENHRRTPPARRQTPEKKPRRV